jgi:hypothetical protein
MPEIIPARAGVNRLPIIAASINDHFAAANASMRRGVEHAIAGGTLLLEAKGAAANASMRRGVEHAIAGGTLLLEAKGLVAHGEWIPWLQENCKIGPRRAQTICGSPAIAIRSRP